jgi:ATP-dependent DNA ligase
MTTDGKAARAWLTGHLGAGVEGVFAKRLDRGYRPGNGASSWRKAKARASAEAVVGGVLGSIAAPVALVVGRCDEHRRLRVVGHTTSLPRAVRSEVGAVLRLRTDENGPRPAFPLVRGRCPGCGG